MDLQRPCRATTVLVACPWTTASCNKKQSSAKWVGTDAVFWSFILQKGRALERDASPRNYAERTALVDRTAKLEPMDANYLAAKATSVTKIVMSNEFRQEGHVTIYH